MSPQLFKDTYFPQLGNIVYLASCSLGAPSNHVKSSMNRMFEHMVTPKLAWHEFEAEVTRLRQKIAALINADVSQIAILPNASTGAYQVASTLSWQAGRSEILYSSDEFPSIANVWVAQTSRMVNLRVINTKNSHTNIISEFKLALTSNTKLVSIPYTSFLDGRNLPVDNIIKLANNVNAKTFIDVYQAIGVQPIDVKQLNCDYLIGGTMKYLLGLPGLAFLYVKDSQQIDLLPTLTGRFARKNPFDFKQNSLDFADGATKFETGTPNISAVYAANAGLELISKLDAKKILSHVNSLTQYAADRLNRLGEKLLYHPESNNHGTHLSIMDNDLLSLTDHFESNGITTSLTCNAVRISFHYYNLKSDIDRFCDVLQAYRKNKLSSELLFCSSVTPDIDIADSNNQDAELITKLENCLKSGNLQELPIFEVADAYHRVGKHFVSLDLRLVLHEIRECICHNADFDKTRLMAFLDILLDKHDNKYDYHSYLALKLINMSDFFESPSMSSDYLDRILMLLLYDVLRFEFAAFDKTENWLPKMPTDEELTSKRSIRITKSIAIFLERLQLKVTLNKNCHVKQGRKLCNAISAYITQDELTYLKLTNFPVYIIHDEYMFIRVLQVFEVTFSWIVKHIKSAIEIGTHDIAQVISIIDSCSSRISDTFSLFALLSTLRADAFREFRVYTEGASAIQSRSYKMIESLCRVPDKDRLNSIAYGAVPEVQKQVLGTYLTLDNICEAVVNSDIYLDADKSKLVNSLNNFEEVLRRWRKMHYGMAVKMLGTENNTGTGYTAGTPYLKAAKDIPVFMANKKIQKEHQSEP